MTALAVWKDLCIDAVDREAQARFWAAASGLELHVSGHNISLDGSTPRHRVWVNGVDRPRTVKNRLHLDIDCAAVDDLVGLGATVLARAEDTGFRWTVMADPEGQEFCAFVREPVALSAYRLHGIGIDCVDAVALAAWWGDVLGATPVPYPEYGGATLEGVAVDDEMTLDFARVPEPRTAPNRLHWDLVGDADAILAAGATQLWQIGGRDTAGWRVLADPEGNEFCVFAAG